MDRESLRLLLEQGESIERIGARFRRHPSTVSYWIAKHGLEANGHAKHAARGGLERELLERLVDDGLSITEIAAAVERSKGTVRHWMKVYGLRTRIAMGTDTISAARNGGLLAIERVCPAHGLTEFVIEGRSYYRCRRCRSEGIARHRRRRKAQLVREAGGACRLCGYDRSLAALEFHHVDPNTKRMGISARGLTVSLEALRAEVSKCVLLCSNCHAEVENGVTELGVKCRPERAVNRSPDSQDAG